MIFFSSSEVKLVTEGRQVLSVTGAHTTDLLYIERNTLCSGFHYARSAVDDANAFADPSQPVYDLSDDENEIRYLVSDNHASQTLTCSRHQPPASDYSVSIKVKIYEHNSDTCFAGLVVKGERSHGKGIECSVMLYPGYSDRYKVRLYDRISSKELGIITEFVDDSFSLLESGIDLRLDVRDGKFYTYVNDKKVLTTDIPNWALAVKGNVGVKGGMCGYGFSDFSVTTESSLVVPKEVVTWGASDLTSEDSDFAICMYDEEYVNSQSGKSKRSAKSILDLAFMSGWYDSGFTSIPDIVGPHEGMSSEYIVDPDGLSATYLFTIYGVRSEDTNEVVDTLETLIRRLSDTFCNLRGFTIRLTSSASHGVRAILKVCEI